MPKEYIMPHFDKFDTDLILASYNPLKEIEETMKQDKYNKIEDKLNGLVDLLYHTEKGQMTAVDLTIKQKNFKLVTDLRDNFHNGRELSKRDMLFCNKVWKRYSGAK
jgi:hypothetical protein